MRIRGAIPSFDWSRLRVDHPDVTATDPNAIESTSDPFEDSATAGYAGGIVGSVDAGTATPDPGDAIGWTWPAYSIDGTRLSAGDVWLAQVLLVVLTAPGASSDVIVMGGLCDQASLSNASLNAVGGGLVFSATNRIPRNVVVAAGSATTTDEGSPNSLSVGALTQFMRRLAAHGDVATMGIESGGGISTSQFTHTITTAVPLSGDLYWWYAVGRDGAGGGTETLEVVPLVYACREPLSGLAVVP